MYLTEYLIHTHKESLPELLVLLSNISSFRLQKTKSDFCAQRSFSCFSGCQGISHAAITSSLENTLHGGVGFATISVKIEAVSSSVTVVCWAVRFCWAADLVFLLDVSIFNSSCSSSAWFDGGCIIWLPLGWFIIDCPLVFLALFLDF